MVKIQQGDVLLKQVDPEEFHAYKEEQIKKQKEYAYSNSWKLASKISKDHGGKCTIALGEATGHHHRFEETITNDAVVQAINTTGWRNQDSPAQCDYLIIENTDKPMKLIHEEHNPVEVPAGYYKVEIVKEFDHFSQMERRVVD
tara:strand:- start:1546 stop:1977 length:432 start_codon:yes stop_codon:yes gene_type:complete